MMKYIKILSIALMQMLTLALAAQTISVDDTTFEPYVIKNIPVKLTGGSLYIASGFYIILPDGFTFTGEVTGKTDSHVVKTCLQNDKTMKVAIYSNKNANFNASTDLLNLQVMAGNISGEFQGTISGIEFASNMFNLISKNENYFTLRVDDILGNSPVEISNWYNDVIAEGTPVTDYTDEAVDKSNWVFYSPELKASGAMPIVNGMLTTNNGTSYAINPAKKNALVLKTPNEPKTLYFSVPDNCEEIYFLVTSSEGASTLKAQVQYEDGTTGTAEQFYVSDWYSTQSGQGEAIYGLDRINRGGSVWGVLDEFDGRAYFRLFEYTLLADKSKKVKGITFTSASYAIPTILGVAKKGYIDPDAIEEIDDSSREIDAIYSVNGQKLNNTQRGVNIIRMSDGSVKKILQK